MPGSAPPTPTPISISITTRSIPTLNTSTRTITSATWSGFSTASRCSTRCAPRASSACRPSRYGGSAKKTARCGTSGIIPAIPSFAAGARHNVQPGHDVDTEGDGDILRVTGLPQPGKRTVEVDTDEPDPRKKLIVDEHMDVYPRTYTVEQYGYHPNELALTFDDSPDPKWTPKILDILKAKHVKGTFMAIGSEAADNIGLMQRIVREGNEIGNHTWTHPDISEISPRQLDLEIKLTERLFESKLGVQPLYFRPPYDIDEEPDTDDEAAPACAHPADGLHHHRQQDRYRRLGRTPRKTPAEIIAVGPHTNLNTMKTKPQFRGSIILMHDGGGDRSVTVAALGPLIDALRAHGYTVRSRLRADGQNHRRRSCRRSPSGSACAPFPTPSPFPRSTSIGNFIVMVFFVGDVLMSARLIIVGLFAIIDRLRQAPPPGLARLQSPRCGSHPRL